ncbi:MAG: GNAT family N-acetyltransferase [Bacteroidota bacterium]
MTLDFEEYFISPIAEKDAWKLCDFVVANETRLKRFFPKTLEANLTPDLSNYFTAKKTKQFLNREEFLFKLEHRELRTIIGLVYIKELDWDKKQGELAYCIGYQYEGKGWTTQSVCALAGYTITDLGLKSLQIITHKSNIGSVKVAQNCGFVWQKTLKQAFTPPRETALDMELYEFHT